MQFRPAHLCRSERWSDLEALLTDLEFVEAKCRLGMIRSLIADYQLASEQHPEWRRAFDEEVTRDESLKQWAKDVMLAGRRWRADLDRIRDDNAQDEIELPVPYPFPSPPDTSTLRAQLLQVARGTRRQLEERVENLQALRAFVTDRAGLLARYPNATLALAFNYSGILAEEAEQKLSQKRDTPWFEERPRPYYDPCAIPLPTLPVDATAFAVSDDGARCVTGESNGDLRFWDLSTGECVAHEVRAHEDEVVRILLAVDGSRVISLGRNGTMEARNFHDRCELWHTGPDELPESKLAACSLEASIIAVVTADDEVLVVDGDTGEVLCKRHGSKFEGITQVQVVPARFQVLVKYDEGKLAAWDLRRVLSSASEDDEPEEELDLSEDDTTELDEYELADFWLRGMDSADRRVQVGFTGLDADLHIHADGEQTTFYGPEGDGTQLYLIASGRVLWENTRHSGWEILKAQNPGQKLPHVNHIRGWDVLSQWSRREFETIYRELKGGNPTQTMKADPEAGDTGIQCYPVHARREEATQPGRSRSVTPDGQIGIAPHIESPTPILHSIPVPIAESTTTELEVRLSPNGLLALVSVSLNERPAGWFLWDIRTGNRVLASSSDDSTLLDISPDWKFIVVIEANELQVRNLLQADQPLWRLPHSRRAFLTPDGRNMVVYSNIGASVWDITQSEPRRILDCDGAQQVLASPDARFLICSDDEMVQFYDLRPGQQSGKPLLRQPCLNALSGEPGARVDCDGSVIIDNVGEAGKFSPNCDSEETQVHLRLRNLSQFTENIEPLVTATRVFRYRLDDPELQQLLAAGGPLPSEYELPGEFDAELTAVCPKCGNRFAVPDGVERAIDELLRADGIPPDQSPCLRLPDSAWADPKLKCQCTHCQQSLRLNPFIA